jgi:hypothetical protein
MGWAESLGGVSTALLLAFPVASCQRTESLRIVPKGPLSIHGEGGDHELARKLKQLILGLRILPYVSFNERNLLSGEKLSHAATLLSGGCPIVGVQRIDDNW